MNGTNNLKKYALRILPGIFTLAIMYVCVIVLPMHLMETEPMISHLLNTSVVVIILLNLLSEWLIRKSGRYPSIIVNLFMLLNQLIYLIITSFCAYLGMQFGAAWFLLFPLMQFAISLFYLKLNIFCR